MSRPTSNSNNCPENYKKQKYDSNCHNDFNKCAHRTVWLSIMFLSFSFSGCMRFFLSKFLLGIVSISMVVFVNLIVKACTFFVRGFSIIITIQVFLLHFWILIFWIIYNRFFYNFFCLWCFSFLFN